MEIVLKSNVNRDKYTDYIQEHFDLAVSDVAEVRIPNNLNLSKLGSEWNIGVICGASGSGKSTILHSLGEITEVEFDNNKPLISNFEPMTPQEASSILCAISWLCSMAQLRIRNRKSQRYLQNGLWRRSIQFC